MLEIIHKLNLILQALLINPIVAEYDQDGWHIRKYANGHCEASLSTTVHPESAGSAIGGVYSTTTKVNLPAGLFIETPRAICSCLFGNGVWSEAYANFTTYIVIAIYRGATMQTSWSVPVYLQVSGRWK